MSLVARIRPSHWLAAVWLAFVIACGVWAGQRLLAGQALETNLLALLPSTERNPRAEEAVGVLAEMLGNRAVLMVGHRDPDAAHAAAAVFAEKLQAGGAFRAVHAHAPSIDLEAFVGFYAPYRDALLSSADRAALARADFSPEERLVQRLFQPFRVGPGTDPGSDPYGTLQNWLSGLPLAQTTLTVERGRLVARDATRTWVLILAELAGSAYDHAVQGPTLAAVAQAEQAMHAAAPQAELLRTGGVFYGATARHSAQQEMDFIGAGSLLGILALLWWLFRSLRPVALSLFTVALGIAVATAAVLAVYGRLHLITLVFGASLIGEAVDYAIQFFAAQLDAGPRWQAREALRRLLRPLLIALLTSLVGYAALALTPFPAVGQIALFAFAGLGAAWLSVVLLLPLLATRPLERDVEAALRLPRRLLDVWRRTVTPARARALVGLCLLASIPGWLMLHADDDIRQLIDRPATLVAQEEQIRALAGFSGGSRFFLVEGETPAQILQREEALTERLRAVPGLAGHQALSDFVPSPARQAENLALSRARLYSPPDAARTRLLEVGLREDLVERSLAQAQSTVPTLRLEDWLAQPQSTPWRHLALPGLTATLVVPQGDRAGLDLAAVADGLPGVSFVDKAGSVSRLFERYRFFASAWIPIAAAIILAVLCTRYGLRRAALVLLPNLLGAGLALAAYGYQGEPLTLFALMGLMLVMGVGVNYAIFIVEAGDRAPAPFAGVLLSAATTLLAFGLLSFSSMPALRHFGSMLLIGVAASVLLAPLAVTLEQRRCD